MNGKVLTLCLRQKAKRRRGARRSALADRRKRRRRSRRGLTAIEYCFMLSIILLGILLAVQQLSSTLTSSLNLSDTKLQEIGL